MNSLLNSKIGEVRTQTRNRGGRPYIQIASREWHRFRQMSNVCAARLSSFAFFLTDFDQKRDCSQSSGVRYFSERHLCSYSSYNLIGAFSRLFEPTVCLTIIKEKNRRWLRDLNLFSPVKTVFYSKTEQLEHFFREIHANMLHLF